MSEFIDWLLKSSKHEEQSYNACAGILHSVKDLSHGLVEEVAHHCIEMNSCRYKTFKQVLGKLQSGDPVQKNIYRNTRTSEESGTACRSIGSGILF